MWQALQPNVVLPTPLTLKPRTKPQSFLGVCQCQGRREQHLKHMFPLRLESHFISLDSSEIAASAFSPVSPLLPCPFRSSEIQPLQEAFPDHVGHLMSPHQSLFFIPALFLSYLSDAHCQFVDGQCGEKQCGQCTEHYGLRRVRYKSQLDQ